MRSARNPLMLLLPVLLLACDTGEMGETGDQQMGADTAAMGDTAGQMDTSAAESEIEQVRNAWTEGAEAGDAAAVASLYADDAVLASPDGEMAEGPQEIEEALAFEGMTGLEVSSTSLEVGTDIAADAGTYRQTFQSAEGQEQILSGRYLVVLRRQDDGNWRIIQHMSTATEEGEEANQL